MDEDIQINFEELVDVDVKELDKLFFILQEIDIVDAYSALKGKLNI